MRKVNNNKMQQSACIRLLAKCLLTSRDLTLFFCFGKDRAFEQKMSFSFKASVFVSMTETGSGVVHPASCVTMSHWLTTNCLIKRDVWGVELSCFRNHLCNNAIKKFDSATRCPDRAAKWAVQKDTSLIRFYTFYFRPNSPLKVSSEVIEYFGCVCLVSATTHW